MTRPPQISLESATVAVTGAARGIGLATAERFVQRGSRVLIGDLDAEAAQQAAEHLGRSASGHALDVTDRDSFSAFLAHAPALDVLVNNAGIMPISSFLEEADTVAHAQTDVNLHGPILGMKLALPGMIERGHGHVVNVASYAGRFAIPGLATYCASKAAVLALTEVVAMELEGSGVTLTAILPSAVHTELASGVPFPFAGVAKVQPEDVAGAIVDSVASRRGEVSVPGWLANYGPFKALAPARLERLARGLFDDRRALTKVDPEARRAYTDRLTRQFGA